MKANKYLLTIACLVATVVGVTWAQIPQNKTELEARHNVLLKDINETQKILNETQKERQASMSQLKALQGQLNNRENLIKTLETDIQNVNQDIAVKTQEINTLSKKIEKLKMVYAQSIRYTYKHQSSHNILAFILTADNFNDGMKRYQYMKKNRDFRKFQADQLKTGQKKIKNNIEHLDSQKKKNEELKNTQVQQKQVVLEETKLKEELVNELKGKETDLITSIEKKKSDAKKLDGIIKKIIQDEILLTQRKKAEEERIKREQELKKQQEIARIEKERQQKIQEENKRIQEQNRKLEEERKRIQEENRQKELLAKNTNSNPSPSPSQPTSPTSNSTTNPSPKVDPKPSTPSLVKNDAPAPKVTPQPEMKKEEVVVASTTRPTEPPKVNPKPENNPTYKNSLTPDMQMTSNNFAANKGRLPSPISGGYVSAPYGKYPHPLEPKVTLENMGIDLAGPAGTPVKCVFNGTVTTVVPIAGTYTVIVNHGEYFTVYSNLSSANVSKGQKVSSNDKIGVVGKNDEGEYIVHFEVCRVGAGNSVINENPSAWINR